MALLLMFPACCSHGLLACALRFDTRGGRTSVDRRDSPNQLTDWDRAVVFAQHLKHSVEPPPFPRLALVHCVCVSTDPNISRFSFRCVQRFAHGSGARVQRAPRLDHVTQQAPAHLGNFAQQILSVPPGRAHVQHGNKGVNNFRL